jgi:dipeptidyl-peptidase-4
VHGTADDNVYFSHAIKLSDALFRAGRPHEFLPLAGFTHMVPEPAVSRRLQARIIDFFRTNLR